MSRMDEGGSTPPHEATAAIIRYWSREIRRLQNLLDRNAVFCPDLDGLRAQLSSAARAVEESNPRPPYDVLVTIKEIRNEVRLLVPDHESRVLERSQRTDLEFLMSGVGFPETLWDGNVDVEFAQACRRVFEPKKIIASITQLEMLRENAISPEEIVAAVEDWRERNRAQFQQDGPPIHAYSYWHEYGDLRLTICPVTEAAGNGSSRHFPMVSIVSPRRISKLTRTEDQSHGN